MSLPSRLLPVLLLGALGAVSCNTTSAGTGITSGNGTAVTPASQHVHHAIDSIEFPVSDMAASKAFYAAAFGWTFTDYGPDYAGIHAIGSGGAREMGGLRLGDAAPGGPLVILHSHDLEASLASVRAAGGKIDKEIFEFPGGRRFEFRDVEGHVLAVWGE